jgi:hypothetical protein
MTKLSDLTLTPEMMAERQARERQRRERIAEIVARAEPHRKARPLGRADLHALLDACLDLAEMRAPDKWPSAVRAGDDEAVGAARIIGRAVAEGAFGWTEPEVPPAVRHKRGAEAWRRLEQTPELWRCEVAERLERSPHVLPPRVVRALADALRHLSDGSGDVPWLLASRRERGRGWNPAVARMMEEAAWCWIYQQKGAGRLIDLATADVAQAVHRSSAAVKKWREAWKARDGNKSVEREFARHKEIGASGKSSPEALLVLTEIAERWLAAVGPKEGEKG